MARVVSFSILEGISSCEKMVAALLPSFSLIHGRASELRNALLLLPNCPQNERTGVCVRFLHEYPGPLLIPVYTQHAWYIASAVHSRCMTRAIALPTRARCWRHSSKQLRPGSPLSRLSQIGHILEHEGIRQEIGRTSTLLLLFWIVFGDDPLSWQPLMRCWPCLYGEDCLYRLPPEWLLHCFA
jgi:hypothetical protein